MPAASPTDQKPAVALIGAGALGTALALALHEQGYPICAVISRTAAHARHLADRVHAPVAAGVFSALPRTARVVFCCVPDDALAAVAGELYLQPHDWPRCIVAHTSGALTAEVLAPLAERGAATLSFHPMQTFPPDSSPERFEGIYVGLEGAPRAEAFGTQLAKVLGAYPVVIPAEAKTRYHLAATLASNFLVTLAALVDEIFATTSLDRQTASALVRPLVETTWQNLRTQRPEDALTGPIARGDRDTILRHRQALAEHLPHLVPVYVALATETVRVAVRGGKLSPDDARGVLDVLHQALEPLP